VNFLPSLICGSDNDKLSDYEAKKVLKNSIKFSDTS